MKRFLAATILSFFAFQSSASAADLTRSEIREFAYAGDYASLEQRLREVRNKSLEEPKDFRTLRWLMYTFQVSDPRMIAFVETWVAEQPQSVYAHTARSRSLDRHAWAIRGPGIARYVHRNAMSIHRQMTDQAYDHAVMAVEIDPDFIPAVEAVLSQAAARPNKSKIFEVLDEVMANHPNWETLFTIRSLALPGWEGSLEKVQYLCNTYAAQIPSDDFDPVFRCRYTLTVMAFRRKALDWLLENLPKAATDPGLDLARVELITDLFVAKTRTDEEIEFARKTILEKSGANLNLAHAFDNAFRYRLGGEYSLAKEVAEKHFEFAKEELLHDPFNAGLLDLADSWFFRRELIPEEKADRDAFFARRHNRHKDFAFRQLVLAPYGAANWVNYGRLVQMTGGPTDIFSGDPYYNNAVVYASRSDRYDAIYSFLANKGLQWKTINSIEEHLDSGPWLDYVQTFDRSALLNCPFVRGYLMLSATCDPQTQDSGMCSPMYEEAYNGLLEVAMADKNCAYLKSQTLEELDFKPVDISLEYNPQEHWPTVE